MARYKVLKSVAHSIGHSFTSLMNYRDNDYVMGHLLSRARKTGQGTIVVNLLSGEATPETLLVRPVREAVEDYSVWFPKHLAAHKTSLEYVRAARMTIAFDLAIQRPSRYAPSHIESPYVCTVEIEDDRGKIWSARLRDWWFPEPTYPSGSLRAYIAFFKRLVRNLGDLLRGSTNARSQSAQAAAA